MFITFLTNQAQKNYAKHWWFLFVSLIGMSAIFGTFVLGDEKSFATIVLLMSIVVGYWALLCMYVWFHPTKGNLNAHSKIMSKLPAVLQTFILWYAAIFLVLFFICGLIVFPIFGFFAKSFLST
jgi:uncharacterized membrane-anchored protein